MKKKTTQELVSDIYELLNKRGIYKMHDVECLKTAKRKIKQLAAKKNKSNLGSAGVDLVTDETRDQLDSLINIYKDRNDPLAGSGFLEDPVMLKKYIDTMPNFIEDLARHFRISNKKYWEEFDKPKQIAAHKKGTKNKKTVKLENLLRNDKSIKDKDWQLPTTTIVKNLQKLTDYKDWKVQPLARGVETIKREKSGNTDQINQAIKNNVEETNKWVESSEYLKNILSDVNKFVAEGFKTGDIRRITNQQQVEAKTAQMLSELTQDYLVKLNEVADKKKEIIKLTEEEIRAIKDRQNAEARAASVSITGPTVAGFDMSKLTFGSANTGAIDSMSSAYAGLAANIVRLNEVQGLNNQKTLEGQMAWVNFGASAGQAIAGIIAADQNFADSVKKTASSMLQQNASLIASWLALKFVKNATTGNIAGATAGLTVALGVVSGLLGKNWKGGSSGSVSGGGGYSRMQPMGVTVYSRQRGTDLVSVGTEESRIRKRTRG